MQSATMLAKLSGHQCHSTNNNSWPAAGQRVQHLVIQVTAATVTDNFLTDASQTTTLAQTSRHLWAHTLYKHTRPQPTTGCGDSATTNQFGCSALLAAQACTALAMDSPFQIEHTALNTPLCHIPYPRATSPPNKTPAGLNSSLDSSQRLQSTMHTLSTPTTHGVTPDPEPVATSQLAAVPGFMAQRYAYPITSWDTLTGCYHHAMAAMTASTSITDGRLPFPTWRQLCTAV